MKKIIQGVQRFQQDSFPARKPLFEQLAHGQKPLALFITCSDSRIDPNLLTHTEPGDLFVLRNPGNIVPPYGSVHSGEAAGIEFAMNILKVPDIFICGHSHCGAMAARLAPEGLGELPAVKNWLIYAEGSQSIAPEHYGHISGVSDVSDPLTIAVEKNVLLQLENLRTHPSVAAALTRNELDLHGWVYQFETGDVFVYDPENERFISIQNL